VLIKAGKDEGRAKDQQEWKGLLETLLLLSSIAGEWLGGKQQEDETICTAKWGGAGERGECDGRCRENCCPVAGRAKASSRVGQALGLLA